MPQVVIIAGPNGAGKTTFASDYLAGPRAHFAFVNADEIAREVARRGTPQRQTDIRAARIMLERSTIWSRRVPTSPLKRRLQR